MIECVQESAFELYGLVIYEVEDSLVRSKDDLIASVRDLRTVWTDVSLRNSRGSPTLDFCSRR
jgi:hypothetical protein